MTIKHDLPGGPDDSAVDNGAMDLAADHTREWLIGTAVVGIALIAWFLVVWLALGRRVWDAAGESIGSGLLLLLIVTLVGAVRRRRRDGD